MTSELDELYEIWARNKAASLLKAADVEAAEELLAKIYAWSKRQKRWGQNAGGWVTDMEYLCWAKRPELRRLARKAGGWWRWHKGEAFVPLGHWMKMFSLQERAKAAHRVYMDSQRQLERLKGKP